MPCIDGRDLTHRNNFYSPSITESELMDLKNELDLLRAAMCGLLRCISINVLETSFDWKKAGISPDDIKQWWANHLLDDSDME